MGGNQSSGSKEGDATRPSTPAPAATIAPLTPQTQFKRRLSVSEGPQPAGSLTGRKAKDADSVHVTSFAGKGALSASMQLDYFCKSMAGSCDGVRKENQDAFVAQVPIVKSTASLFGVFDGHGKFGRECSTFVRDYMKKNVNEATLEGPEKALKNVFSNAQKAIGKSGTDCFLSGTTCVVCVCTPTQLIVANAGDSRCVLGSRDSAGQFYHRDLSRDHKPELAEEKKRIKKAGGLIKRLRDYDDTAVGPYRVWAQHTPAPGLAMSRSIGDELAHSVGVSCKPEIITHDIDLSRDRFMILASDGVWEFISSKEAVKICAASKCPEDASNALCRLATIRWGEEEEFAVDDITALVVFFQPNTATTSKS
eukprot:c8228_g1_i1.p1 GENE.c8228_g1_i1~~c8228_g1_i1.p1  ORF type:complete len:366 (+),score=82.32 c8228_g1_i1:147-1244(+)